LYSGILPRFICRPDMKAGKPPTTDSVLALDQAYGNELKHEKARRPGRGNPLRGADFKQSTVFY